MAYDPHYDQDLVRLDAGHLFATNTTRIGFRRGTFLRSYMYDFIQLFSPHLTRARVCQAEQLPVDEVEGLFAGLGLPVF